VGSFYTTDAASRQFKHEYLPMETVQPSFGSRQVDKETFTWFLRGSVLSFVSVS
jgi:hypothetical protein